MKISLVRNTLLLSLLFPGIAAAAHRGITVEVKNQGDGKVSYFESQGGMSIPCPVEPAIGADSIFHVSFPDGDDTEYVMFRYIRNGKYSLFPMYISGKGVQTLTIDGAAENIFTSSLPEADLKAIEASRGMEEAYMNFVMGKDYMGLKRDSIPASVYGKIMAFADSLADVTKCSPRLHPALRQEIYLNAYQFFREVKARQEHRTHNKQLLDQWTAKNEEFERKTDFQNPLNALSMTMLHIHPSAPEYMGDGSGDDLNRYKTDYYRSFYSGRNAECLEASVIFTDIDLDRYSAGVPKLYEEFRRRYPESPLLPRLEEAVARNIAVNSGMNDSEIVFLDSIPSVEALVSRFKGAPVLLDIWASWCGSCRKNFTRLEPLRKFAAENGLKLVYITIDTDDDGKKSAKQIAMKLGVKGTHAIAGKDLYQDVFRTFGSSSGSMMIPHVALYDAQGKLLVRKFDESENPEGLVERLKTLL